jgi:nucleotidyltransferase substrate binding protein (TIGR01987 family)
MHPEADVRWKQRFQSFHRAFNLLREAMQNGSGALNALEKEGVVQRFEYSLELAWNTLNDYLIFGGRPIEPVSPRNVIKAAFAARLLRDGQVWIDMLEHRNLLSHTYSQINFANAVQEIESRYLVAFEALHTFLLAELEKS